MTPYQQSLYRKLVLWDGYSPAAARAKIFTDDHADVENRDLPTGDQGVAADIESLMDDTNERRAA